MNEDDVAFIIATVIMNDTTIRRSSADDERGCAVPLRGEGEIVVVNVPLVSDFELSKYGINI